MQAPANCTGFCDLIGNDAPFLPSLKLTGFASYVFDLGGSDIVTSQSTRLWSGRYFNPDFDTIFGKQDSSAKLNLRLGWRSASDQFSIEVFVNNATNRIARNRPTLGSRGLIESFDAPAWPGFASAPGSDCFQRWMPGGQVTGQPYAPHRRFGSAAIADKDEGRPEGGVASIGQIALAGPE